MRYLLGLLALASVLVASVAEADTHLLIEKGEGLSSHGASTDGALRVRLGPVDLGFALAYTAGWEGGSALDVGASLGVGFDVSPRVRIVTALELGYRSAHSPGRGLFELFESGPPGRPYDTGYGGLRVGPEWHWGVGKTKGFVSFSVSGRAELDGPETIDYIWEDCGWFGTCSEEQESVTVGDRVDIGVILRVGVDLDI